MEAGALGKRVRGLLPWLEVCVCVRLIGGRGRGVDGAEGEREGEIERRGVGLLAARVREGAGWALGHGGG